METRRRVSRLREEFPREMRRAGMKGAVRGEGTVVRLRKEKLMTRRGIEFEGAEERGREMRLESKEQECPFPPGQPWVIYRLSLCLSLFFFFFHFNVVY